MNETTDERMFAYGKDYINGTACPACAAGFAPGEGGDSITVAEWYDSMVSALGYSNDDSVIPEEQAREAWLKAVEGVRGRYGDCHLTHVGEEIARELGWM